VETFGLPSSAKQEPLVGLSMVRMSKKFEGLSSDSQAESTPLLICALQNI
jgi:hypothetical protein